MLGVGTLFAWNAFITAATYFSSRFCGSSHEKTFENDVGAWCKYPSELEYCPLAQALASSNTVTAHALLLFFEIGAHLQASRTWPRT